MVDDPRGSLVARWDQMRVWISGEREERWSTVGVRIGTWVFGAGFRLVVVMDRFEEVHSRVEGM